MSNADLRVLFLFFFLSLRLGPLEFHVILFRTFDNVPSIRCGELEDERCCFYQDAVEAPDPVVQSDVLAASIHTPHVTEVFALSRADQCIVRASKRYAVSPNLVICMTCVHMHNIVS